MKGGLRKSMTWLHTWSSLIVIWILFAIFLTGTTSFFRAEITHWMTPEHHVSTPVDQPLHAAVEYLEFVAPYGETWQISLPDSRSPVLGLNWQAEGEERQRRRGDLRPQVGRGVSAGGVPDGFVLTIDTER